MRRAAGPLLGCLAGVALAPTSGCGAPAEKDGVSYDARYGDATTMDVFMPSDDGRRHAGVLLIDGGAWTAGSKADLGAVGKRLARSGWVAATINYRLLPGMHFPQNVQDCACALAFFRQHADDYHLDPARVAVWGYSAGGHLASLLGVATGDQELAPDCAAGTPSPPAAVIDGAGPTDLRYFEASPEVKLMLGGTPDEVPHAYDLASPVKHVAPGDPPFLLIKGNTDALVGDQNTAEMHDCLAAAGDHVELLTLSGGGHVLNPDPSEDAWSTETADDTPEAQLVIPDFLVRMLGNP